MRDILTQSQDMSTEYCISIVRIGELKPIENSDFLATVSVNGRDIVIRKDQVKEGDILFYASNECQLNSDFLSINNLFEDYSLNANREEVEKWMEENADHSPEERQEYLRSRKGYFNKYGRVRMTKLRGTISMGYLFTKAEMVKWCPSFINFDLEAHVGEDFDTVNDVLFVKAYVPMRKESGGKGKTHGKDRLLSFDRMIPGQFSFHYDTSSLNKCISQFTPDDALTISVKEHGHSGIFGNIKVKKPLFGGFYSKMFCCLPKFLQFTKEEYDIVRSSRKVIINSDINPKKGIGYNGNKVQDNITWWAEKIGRFIPRDITLYAEIVGYYEGINEPIQSVDGMVYDYKAKPGENHLMIYRISQKLDNGDRKEYEIKDVLEFTHGLISQLEEIGEEKVAERIKPIQVLYEGTLRDLYPELDVHNHWHENVLEALKKDKAHFGMEDYEPMCRNKCFREGIVVRRVNDAIPAAYKLKCLSFLGREAKDMDKGNTGDVEMMETY